MRTPNKSWIMGVAPHPFGVETFHAHRANDERGWCIELQNPGYASRYHIPTGDVARVFVAHNPRAYTLRGLHFLHHPEWAKNHPASWEKVKDNTKIVACMSGTVFDVLVDLRKDSPTYHQWSEIVLSPGDAIRVPMGIAHGYMTLQPNTSLIYLLSSPERDNCGLRWDDPKIGIDWPAKPTVISERDQAWELL